MGACSKTTTAGSTTICRALDHAGAEARGRDCSAALGCAPCWSRAAAAASDVRSAATRRRERLDPRGDRRPLPRRRLERAERADRERRRPRRTSRKSFGDASGVAEGVPITVDDDAARRRRRRRTALAGAARLPVALRPRGPLLAVRPRQVAERELPARRAGEPTPTARSRSRRSSRPRTRAAGRTSTSRSTTSLGRGDAAAGASCATSQLALPQDACDAVYATTGYEQSVREPRRDVARTPTWCSATATPSQLGDARDAASVDDGYTLALQRRGSRRFAEERRGWRGASRG